MKERSTERAFVVCLDPGHPSEVSDGARENGLSENHINYAVARRLARQLDAQGIVYRLTKQRETEFVTNRRRAEIANACGAALFLRLHCDSGNGSGYTWYYPDRAVTRHGVTGPPRNVQIASRHAAQALNDTMRPLLRGYLRENPVKTDAATFVGGRQGGVLTGSLFARVPTALLEMGVLNHPADAHFLASAAGQERMAVALAHAIAAYRRAKRTTSGGPG